MRLGANRIGCWYLACVFVGENSVSRVVVPSEKLVPPGIPEIRKSDLRAAFDATVRDALRPASAGLGALFAILAVSHALVLPRGIAPVMTSIATVTALALVGLSLALTKWLIPLRWAHPVGAAVAALALLNGLILLYLTAELQQTTYLLMLMIGAGFLFLSDRWFAVVMAAIWAGWGVVVWLSPPLPEWLHFGFALLIATVLAVIIHTMRVRTLMRLEALRFQQEFQRANLERSLASTEESRRLAEMLNLANRALTGTLDLTRVLERVLDYLHDIVLFDRGSVMLASGDQLEIVAARGFPPDAQPLKIHVSLVGDDNDLYRQIYLSQQALAIADVSRRADWQYVKGLPAARSWLGAPLIRAGVVIGMLSLARETLQPYTNDEMTLVMAFAGQAALALENARLYDQIVKDYTQLEQLDRTKSDFISVASHELRTPLTTLQGYSQMLMSDPVIKANPYHAEVVAGLYSGAVRLHEIVDSMLDVAKIDSRALRLHLKPLSVSSLVQRVCSELDKPLKERHHTLELGGLNGLPQVEADLDGLRKVFHHLIVNAIKYTPDGGTITITGRTLASGEEELEGGVEIVVCDTGIGIDPRYHEQVFDKFYQTGQVALHSSGMTKFKGGGPGLGLTIARGIVQAHGGKLWVSSPGYDEVNCPGSQFHIVLPLRQPSRVEATLSV